jgi:thiol-disulfide isomerase/thioredoxin
MHLKILTLLFVTALAATADELLPLLKVNDDVYTNVIVTAVTPTDIYFTSDSGMGNAKLKNLDPELQKHFHYNAAESKQVENRQAQDNVEYRKQLLNAAPVQSRPAETEQQSSAAAGDDFVVPKLYAKSFRGQRAPHFVVEKWLTPAPDTTGKFVLIDFWATWCGPCRRSIPEINGFYAKYGDRMAVIGVSDETEEAVRKMTSPQINYAVAIDTQRRMMDTLEIKGIPHTILIDPRGIVRYEGMPQYLDDQKLEHFLDKYK